MHIKSIMTPVNDLYTLSTDDTVGHAIQVIEAHNLLSLPVLEGDKFAGILSTKFVYETFFNDTTLDKATFLEQKVKAFMKTKIPTLEENILIEHAAKLFIESKLRFIPVVNKKEELLGIITHNALFRQYQHIFGFKLPKIVIHSYDFKGKLAKISDIISKAGGNIKNIVQMDTEIMGLQEISIRIDCKDINKVIKQLQDHNIEVREFTED